MNCLHRTPRQVRQRGLTLIEVMVGLTLGMIVTTALLMLFARASGDGQNLQRASAHIENGRYAAELLREEVQLAGYFGETVSFGVAHTAPDPCATDPAGAFLPAPLTLPTAVRGYGAAEVLGCLAGRSRRAGTDALAVRRLDPQAVDPATLPGGNAVYHLQYTFCPDDPTAPPLVFSRQAADFTLRNRGCAAANPVRPYVARLYFIADCSRCGSGGDSLPTLKRLDLVGGQLVETALVEGVETMRLEYGFDTDGNGSADDYRLAPAASGPASEWQNVVAVRVHLIVRSLDRALGPSLATAQTFSLGAAGEIAIGADGFVRRAYTTTVRLMNPSGAREAP